MTIVGDLVRGMESRASAANPPEWLQDALGANRSYAGESVTAKSALEVGAFFACLRLLGMSVGMTPMLVYKGEGRERERARGTTQWKIVHDAPNEETAADVFWQTVLGDLVVGNGRYGDAFLEKARVASGPRAGSVTELWRLDPCSVTVDREKTGQRRKVFKVDGDSRTYYADTILHIPGYSTGGLRGVSIVYLARQDLGTAVGRERYEGNYYLNGATFPGYLTTEGTLSETAAKRIAEGWASLHGGNKHKTPVLEGGLKFEAVSSPMREQQFAELARLTANKVARWFGIDPEMIGGDRSSQTYATVEGRALHFLTFALDPWLVRIEKGLRRDPDLFANVDLWPEFLRSALLRTDAKSRWEIYGMARDAGAYSPNDILFKENEPPRPGGDTYIDAPAGAAPATDGNGNGSRHMTPEEQRQWMAGVLADH